MTKGCIKVDVKQFNRTKRTEELTNLSQMHLLDTRGTNTWEQYMYQHATRFYKEE